MTDFSALPRRDGVTWMGGRRPTEFESEEPMHQIVWVEEESLELRSVQVVPEDAGTEALWEALVQAMSEPEQGEPARPERVLVADRDQQRALEAHAAAADIEVGYQEELPEVDEAMEFLDMLADSPDLGYLRREDGDPKVVADYFEAAERFWIAAPWRWMEDDEILVVEGASLEPVYVCVLGPDAEECGLAVFPSREDLEGFLEAEEEDTGQYLRLILNYWLPETVGLPAVGEAEEHGWPLVDGEWYPVAMNPSKEEGLLAGPDDLRLLMRLMEAVAGFSDRAWWRREQGDESLTLVDGTAVRLKWPVDGLVLPDEVE